MRDELTWWLLLGVALYVQWRAYRGGFYRIPPSYDLQPRLLLFRHVASAFLLYACVMRGLPLLLFQVWTPRSFLLLALFEGGLLLLTLFLLISNLMTEERGREVWTAIWRGEGARSRDGRALMVGAATWCLGFPVTAFVSWLLDRLLAGHGVSGYEQLVVRYLRVVAEVPSALCVMLFCLVVLGPLLEELLFRGLLQSWLRPLVGAKAALLLSSALFALFHVAAQQGWGNLSILPSLFVFSCYLGLLYEREHSLLAPFALHATFNAINAGRILLCP